SAFRLLQGTHARTQFSQEETPPLDRGRMCSIVSDSGPGCAPQYWHVWRSRLKRFFREKTTDRSPWPGYPLSRITSGGAIDSFMERIVSPSNRALAFETSFHVLRSCVWYVSGSMMRAEPFATRLIASRAEVTWIGIHARFRTRAGLSRRAVLVIMFLIGPERQAWYPR